MLFVPAVMAMGGNSGIQTSTVTVRALATGALRRGRAGQALWRELGAAGHRSRGRLRPLITTLNDILSLVIYFAWRDCCCAGTPSLGRRTAGRRVARNLRK